MEMKNKSLIRYFICFSIINSTGAKFFQRSFETKSNLREIQKLKASVIECTLKCNIVPNCETSGIINDYCVLYALQQSSNSTISSITDIFNEEIKLENENQVYIIRHSSGLCLEILEISTTLFLTSSCTTKFYFSIRGQIKTVVGGKCLKREKLYSGYSWVKTTVCEESSADYQNTLYKHLLSGSIMHIATGQCFVPLKGFPYSTDDTRILLFAECDQYRLKFTFEEV